MSGGQAGSAMETAVERRRSAEYDELSRRLAKAREIGAVREDPAAESLKQHLSEVPSRPEQKTDESEKI